MTPLPFGALCVSIVTGYPRRHAGNPASAVSKSGLRNRPTDSADTALAVEGRRRLEDPLTRNEVNGRLEPDRSGTWQPQTTVVVAGVIGRQATRSAAAASSARARPV
jgi:hypothetical protein